MDRYYEPRDWVPATTRCKCQSLTVGAKTERQDGEIDAKLDLERVKLSMLAAISAWGV